MSSNQASSMRALLESLTAGAEKVSNEKESAEDIKQAPAQPLDPGTAAVELADDPSKNESVVEGERAAEHDANINDTLGEQAAVNSAGPVHASDDQQAAPAAEVAKATEDPESQERSAVAPVAEIEPGTEAVELKLSVEDWTKQATELLVDLTVAAKVAAEKDDEYKAEDKEEDKEDDKADDDKEESKEAEDVKSDDRPAAGEEAEEPTPEPKVEGEGEGNKEVDPGTAQKESEEIQDPCDVLAGGDKEAAEQLRSLVHHQLTDAVSYGSKLAADTIAFLEVAREEKEAMFPMEAAPVADAPVAPIEDAPVEEAPVEEAPVEEEAGDDLAEDPALIEEALTELAAEMGVAPEELGQLLAGAGEDAGPAVDEGAMAAEEAMAGKAAADESDEVAFGFKVAAAKSAIKKDALELLAETVARGRR